jgi:drug/metabolite transporter (DMT)-like permease
VSAAGITDRNSRPIDSLLAWYFVTIWGSGFIATKIGLMHAPPFKFLSVRFAFGIACLIPLMLWWKPRWPQSLTDYAHIIIAGLLMHAMHLGGSHYSQYLGLSAGVTAVLLAVQPLITALIAGRWLNEPVRPIQWTGIVIGLAGVTMVVWHKLNLLDAPLGGLIAVTISLVGVTGGTLYQRKYCPAVDLRSAAMIQFVSTFLVVAPLAWGFETAPILWSWALVGAIGFLVIGASMLAVSALHILMRHGQATKVTSLIYLTPVFAVVLEGFVFDVVPTGLTAIGMVVTCMGIALVARRPRKVPGSGT